MNERNSHRELHTYRGQTVSDSVLIRRCMEGNVDTFGIIVHRYQKIIFNIVCRMVTDRDASDDITQTAFIKAYENIDRYKHDFPFLSWLQKIAVNEALNYLKQRKRIVALNGSYEPNDVSDPAIEYARNELEERVDRALEKLKPEYRIIIVLRHFGELSYREIGEILDVPEKTVKSRLFTVRQELRSVFI